MCWSGVVRAVSVLVRSGQGGRCPGQEWSGWSVSWSGVQQSTPQYKLVVLLPDLVAIFKYKEAVPSTKGT